MKSAVLTLAIVLVAAATTGCDKAESLKPASDRAGGA